MVKAFNIFPVRNASSSNAEHEEEDRLPELSLIEMDDVATNIESMINQYFTVSILHLRSPIHILQLAIKDTIDTIDEHESCL